MEILLNCEDGVKFLIYFLYVKFILLKFNIVLVV